MASPLSIYISCGGKWVENDQSEFHFKLKKQSKTQVIEWDRCNTDFNALLRCIYQNFGLEQRKHQLEVSYQTSRFGRGLKPIIIASDKALGSFLRDKEVESTLLRVEVTEVEERETENQHDGQFFFQDEYFDCNLIFDQGSGHGQEGVVLNGEPNTFGETFLYRGSNHTPNTLPDNVEVEVELHKSAQEHFGFDGEQPNSTQEHAEAEDELHKNTQEHVGVEVADGQCSRLPDDFDFPLCPVDGDSGADGTFEDGSDLVIGYEFANKAELKRKMIDVAIAGCFETKTEKSDSTRYILRCRGANCSWMMRAFAVKDSPRFIIKKYNKSHNCAVGERKRNHRQTTSRYVGEVVLATLGGSREHIKPKTIMTLMQNRSMPITYTKAWLGRKFANEKLYGKPCENYAKLPLYLHMLKEANHGRVYTNLEVDEDGCFKYVFVAFYACTSGFKALRQVISVDGTFCKTLEKGVLLIATAQDGDFHQYPLAWAIVDSENNESYSYFFGHLCQLIEDHSNLVFISDRHANIEHGLRKHYSLADYGYCRYHIHCNLKNPVRKNKDALKIFDQVANAYTERSYYRLLKEFEERFPNGARYIATIPKERWARAFFQTNRYNIMTTNGAESINSVLRHTRTLPVLSLLTGMQSKTAEWRGRRHTELNALEGSSSPLTPNAEAILRKRYPTTLKLESMRLSLYEFQVKGVTSDHVVNLCQMTCTCRVFDLDKIPCVHALACLTDEIKNELGISAYHLCDHKYTRSHMHVAYAETLYPVPAFDEWEANGLELQHVMPPKMKKKRGRPATKRIPSAGEKRKRWDLTCYGCHNKGHTIRTCKKKTQDQSEENRKEMESELEPETEPENEEEF